MRPKWLLTWSSPAATRRHAKTTRVRFLESKPAQRRESRQCYHPHGPATSWWKAGRIISVAPPVAPPEVRSIGPRAAQPAPLLHRPTRPAPANNIERLRIARLKLVGMSSGFETLEPCDGVSDELGRGWRFSRRAADWLWIEEVEQLIVEPVGDFVGWGVVSEHSKEWPGQAVVFVFRR